MNDDLQAPIQPDHNSRRRAYQIIFAIYGAFALINLGLVFWKW